MQFLYSYLIAFSRLFIDQLKLSTFADASDLIDFINLDLN